MPARLLVIGFDSFEATLVDQLVAAGVLPTFARLRQQGTTAELANRVELAHDTAWIELATGRSAARLGWYWQPRQVHQGETVRRPNTPADFDLTSFWNHASAAGRRAAVVDSYHTGPSPGINGLHLRGWGVHYPLSVGSDPPELFQAIERKYGVYPFPHTADRSCDAACSDGSPASMRFVLDRLHEAVALRTRLLADLLDRERWDLFFGTFAECHCLCHNYWHLLDRRSPAYRDDQPELRAACESLCAAMDRALAHLVERAGSGATTLVFLSHGMGPNYGGWQLLPEVLFRLGYTPQANELAATETLVPEPLLSAKTRAIAEYIGRNGAIRLNVVGRDPHGCIRRGDEYEAACAELTRELLALRDAATDRPVIDHVHRLDRALGEDRHPNLPDLIVRFCSDRPITAVRSPRIGEVSGPIPDRRTGEHAPSSRLWAVGPGIAAGRALTGADVLDLAPTVLSLLDVALPPGLDGEPLVLREAAAAPDGLVGAVRRAAPRPTAEAP